MIKISDSELRRRLGVVLALVLGRDRVRVDGDRVRVDGIDLEQAHAIGVWAGEALVFVGAPLMIRSGSTDLTEIVDARLENWLGRTYDDDRDMLSHVIGSVGGDESCPSWWMSAQ